MGRRTDVNLRPVLRCVIQVTVLAGVIVGLATPWLGRQRAKPKSTPGHVGGQRFSPGTLDRPLRSAAAPATMTRQVRNVVTGPSGAGKSSFCRDQPDWQYNLHNLDDKVRLTYGVAYLNDAEVRENARGVAQTIREDPRDGRTPVTVDHVFDSRTTDEVVGRRAPGIRRAHLGGGDRVSRPLRGTSPAEGSRSGSRHGRRAVRELFEDALHAASELSLASDVTYLIDNSGLDGFLPIARVERFTPDVRCAPIPLWAGQRFLAGSLGPRGRREDRRGRPASRPRIRNSFRRPSRVQGKRWPRRACARTTLVPTLPNSPPWRLRPHAAVRLNGVHLRWWLSSVLGGLV